MVGHQIFKVIRSLTLVGVEVKMSGIRPEIAQTMVQLGVDFEDTLSISILHQALEYIGFRSSKPSKKRHAARRPACLFCVSYVLFSYAVLLVL